MKPIPTAERIDLPPYPSGWYAVVASHELTPGQVERRQYFGRELVVYRSASGAVAVADAYCPHLGAHLGYGGHVEGERLVCPFHGWQFGRDGRCEAMPYGQRIPATARLRTWQALEQNGMVLVYFDGLDGSGTGADWKPPSVDLGAFTATRSRRWKLASHPQEIMENSADGAHFRYIHKTHYMAVAEGPTLDGTAYDIVFQTDPEGVAPADRAPEGSPDLRYHVIVYGPGMVHGFMQTEALDVTTLSRVYVTPIDGELVEMCVTSNIGRLEDREAGETIAEATAAATFAQVEDDVVIWHNKRYRADPRLNDAEPAIASFRRWFRQFYPAAVR